MSDNPVPSPITRAYFDAQKSIGGLPTTMRESALFEALQDSLQKLYDSAALYADCIERIRDVQDELEKVEGSPTYHIGVAWERWIEDAPEPEVNLVTVKRIIENRRRDEPLVPPQNTYGDDSAYRDLVRDREATDLIEQLAAEVEAWRVLAKETP